MHAIRTVDPERGGAWGRGSLGSEELWAHEGVWIHGDDFRAIDWNVSARLGHPYVKTFMEERELTVLLIVDQSGDRIFS